MSEPAKPLACPFCGSEGKAVTDSSSHWHWVICSSEPKDAMLIGCDDTAAKAIARWNTRAADPRLAELEARHAKAIACLKLIESEGGGEPDFSASRGGDWCSEQARRTLEECG